MDKIDRKKLDVYLGADYGSKIDFVKEALPIPKTSLIVWLLFRGFLDYHKKRTEFTEALKKYHNMKKVEDREKIQIYISSILEEKIYQIHEDRLKMKRQEFLNKTIKMELNKFSKRLYIDKEKIMKMDKGKNKKFYILLDDYLYGRLEKIRRLTGISLNSLISLMLFEYLNILDKGRYE